MCLLRPHPLQCTLLSNGGLSRLPPPEQEASQGNRRLSLGPQSTAKTAASGSTARKRPAAGSTAKKGGGEGSRSELSKGVCVAVESSQLLLPGQDCWAYVPAAQCQLMPPRPLPCRTTARAWLARDAQRLRLPTLYYWFKPDHQHLSEVSIGYTLLRRLCCLARRGQAACRCVDQKRRG